MTPFLGTHFLALFPTLGPKGPNDPLAGKRFRKTPSRDAVERHSRESRPLSRFCFALVLKRFLFFFTQPPTTHLNPTPYPSPRDTSRNLHPFAKTIPGKNYPLVSVRSKSCFLFGQEVSFRILAHQNRTIAIASDFRVDGAKSPEIPQKEGVLGSEIAARNRKSLATFHRTLKSQCNIALSCLGNRAISGVRDGHRNRKSQKSLRFRCAKVRRYHSGCCK